MREDDTAKIRLMRLLSPVHDRARRTARRLCRSDADGDDLFQDAVIRAFERLGTLRDDEAFGAWFHRILLSLHRTRMRRPLWRRWIPLDETPELVGDDAVGWTTASGSAERIRRALSVLPDVQREAIVLFELDGYTIDEIAKMQAVSPSAVKTRLSRGRARLRRYYERLERQMVDKAPIAMGSATGRRS